MAPILADKKSEFRKQQQIPDPPDPPTDDELPVPPVNCSTAALLEVPTVRNGIITGALEIGLDVPLCGRLAPDTRGIWYAVEGNGLCYTASITNSDFDTLLQIYNGTCSNLSCVNGSEDTVTWQTLDLQTYYILLGGMCVTKIAGSVSMMRLFF